MSPITREVELVSCNCVLEFVPFKSSGKMFEIVESSMRVSLNDGAVRDGVPVPDSAVDSRGEVSEVSEKSAGDANCIFSLVEW